MLSVRTQYLKRNKMSTGELPSTITQLREITPEQLNALFNKLSEKIDNLQSNPPAERYLKRKEVAKLFDVNIKTVASWNVPTYELGGAIYYKLSDIENTMKLRSARNVTKG